MFWRFVNFVGRTGQNFILSIPGYDHALSCPLTEVMQCCTCCITLRPMERQKTHKKRASRVCPDHLFSDNHYALRCPDCANWRTLEIVSFMEELWLLPLGTRRPVCDHLPFERNFPNGLTLPRACFRQEKYSQRSLEPPFFEWLRIVSFKNPSHKCNLSPERSLDDKKGANQPVV